jgi:hypothetical protein
MVHSSDREEELMDQVVSSDLPVVTLNFTPSTTPVVGTQGRAIAYRKVPALDIAIAFIKGPWGTYIELTEGLDKVQ